MHRNIFHCQSKDQGKNNLIYILLLNLISVDSLMSGLMKEIGFYRYDHISDQCTAISVGVQMCEL